jgi:hypothetical protein
MPGTAYFFLIELADEKKKHEIDANISSRLENAVFADKSNNTYLMYAAVFPNMSEADETYRWIKSLDEAEKTKMYVMREIISIPDWLDKETDRRLRESE